MDELIKKKLQTIILKSERSLRIADGLINQGDYDVACSRAYYCAFYIMEGLLITKGLEFSKHSSVMGAFNKNFIHSGERGITPETAWLFSKLFGTTPEFWMNLQMNYDLTVRKPVVKLKTLQSLKLPLAV